MTEQQIVQWAKLLGWKLGAVGGEWVHVSCPLSTVRHEGGSDNTPSFGIRVGPGDSHCFCLGCAWSGSQAELLIDCQQAGLGTPAFNPALDAIVDAEDEAGLDGHGDYESEVFGPPVDQPFEEMLLEAFEPAYATGFREKEGERWWRVHPYLDSRLVPYEVAEKLDLRFDGWRQRIVFPVRNWGSALCGLHGRAIDDNVTPRYLMYAPEHRTNPQVWLGEHWIDPELPIVIAESVFDLARVFEVYENVLSPLTASLGDQKLKRLDGAQMLVTLFDGDKAGELARERVSKRYHQITHHVVPPHGMDAGDMTPEQVTELLTPVMGDWLC